MNITQLEDPNILLTQYGFTSYGQCGCITHWFYERDLFRYYRLRVTTTRTDSGIVSELHLNYSKRAASDYYRFLKLVSLEIISWESSIKLVDDSVFVDLEIVPLMEAISPIISNQHGYELNPIYKYIDDCFLDADDDEPVGE